MLYLADHDQFISQKEQSRPPLRKQMQNFTSANSLLTKHNQEQTDRQVFPLSLTIQSSSVNLWSYFTSHTSSHPAPFPFFSSAPRLGWSLPIVHLLPHSPFILTNPWQYHLTPPLWYCLVFDWLPSLIFIYLLFSFYWWYQGNHANFTVRTLIPALWNITAMLLRT